VNQLFEPLFTTIHAVEDVDVFQNQTGGVGANIGARPMSDAKNARAAAKPRRTAAVTRGRPVPRPRKGRRRPCGQQKNAA